MHLLLFLCSSILYTRTYIIIIHCILADRWASMTGTILFIHDSAADRASLSCTTHPTSRGPPSIQWKMLECTLVHPLRRAAGTQSLPTRVAEKKKEEGKKRVKATANCRQGRDAALLHIVSPLAPHSLKYCSRAPIRTGEIKCCRNERTNEHMNNPSSDRAELTSICWVAFHPIPFMFLHSYTHNLMTFLINFLVSAIGWMAFPLDQLHGRLSEGSLLI